MATASSEQALLFSLRSPTTPLPNKLQLAHSALSSTTVEASPLLSPLIRDWLLDQLLRGKNNAELILSNEIWSLLDTVQAATPPNSSSLPSLPIFVAFLSSYSALEAPNTQLLAHVASTWRRLAQQASRKANLDQSLEGYAQLLKSSLVVLGRDGDDAAEWSGMTETWLKAFRSVVDSGKGAKKVRSALAFGFRAFLPPR